MWAFRGKRLNAAYNKHFKQKLVCSGLEYNTDRALHVRPGLLAATAVQVSAVT